MRLDLLKRGVAGADLAWHRNVDKLVVIANQQYVLRLQVGMNKVKLMENFFFGEVECQRGHGTRRAVTHKQHSQAVAGQTIGFDAVGTVQTRSP